MTEWDRLRVEYTTVTELIDFITASDVASDTDVSAERESTDEPTTSSHG